MSTIYQIIKCLIAVGKSKINENSSELSNLIKYIETNYTNNITISDLASVALLSESYLYAKFKNGLKKILKQGSSNELRNIFHKILL